uniref:RING-type domain-containing protein n=1 Tax=Strongyloides venezuelensis TaxID=75913 RepID=A0A0K0FWQ7_STRVS
DKLKKHLSKDAYLSKSIVIDENIGNREKNRIVCETSADSISPNVSYSLNRKNRWDTITPMSLNINAINCIPKDMTVAVVEQMNTIPDIGCVNEKTNKHFVYGCVTGVTTINKDGHVTVKSANGPAGAHLASLLGNNEKNNKSPDSENVNANVLNDSSKGKAQVRYHINTPQNNTDYSIGVHFKRQLKAKLKEKKFIGKKSRKLNNKYNIDTSEIMSDSDEVSEVEELYLNHESFSPKFSLSDFVKEASPVIVENYIIDNVDKLIPLNNDKVNPNNLISLPDDIRAGLFFNEISIDVSKWKKIDFNDVDKLIEEKYYDVKWIDKSKNLFQFDISNMFSDMLDILKKIKLLVIMRGFQNEEEDTLKIIFNGSFQIPEIKEYKYFKKYITENLQLVKTNDSPIKYILDRSIHAMIDWFLNFGVEIWQKENILKNSICKEYENSYNSERISKTVIPLDENDLYEFLSNQTSKTFGNKSSDSENFDSKSDDNFEKIYLSEFNDTEEIEFSDESCIICIGPLFSETSITLCDCNHNFCSECIRKILYKQIRLEITPLHCPICQTNISIKFLPIIFPLPLISFYIHFQYKKEMKKRGIKTSNCVKCTEIVNIDSVSDYNIVNCQKCNVFWCILCNESPHFPLTCKENFEWKLKFDGESRNIEKTEMIDEKKYIPQKFL